MAQTGVGEIALRPENVQELVKNISMRAFEMKKNIATVVKSNAWTEGFYRESATTVDAIDDIPRGAEFPQDTPKWDKITTRLQKFGIEGFITWEDAMTDKVDVIARTIARLTMRITERVDLNIWNALTENQSASAINTFAASATWNNVTRTNRKPHEDIALAARTISDSTLQSYRADTIILSPFDWAYVITNDDILAAYTRSKENVMKSGIMGDIMGLDVLVSPVVTADYAAVCQKKVCLTYREAESLRSVTIKDEGKGHTIRVWETGVAQVTDPKAICLITNTQA